MTAKMKASTRSSILPLAAEPPVGLRGATPWTTEERLQRIAAMGQRIDSYIQFMTEIGKMSGTSTEAKDKAVAAFYDRMVVLERELGRIQEELHLG
jgi:hypothetical protein